MIEVIDAAARIDSHPAAADPIVRADMLAQLQEAVLADVAEMRRLHAIGAVTRAIAATAAVLPRA